jgi:hypothetical protein
MAVSREAAGRRQGCRRRAIDAPLSCLVFVTIGAGS